MIVPVSTVSEPSIPIDMAKRSMPRGAGPPRFSPHLVVLRTVAGALKPLRCVTVRHSTTKMRALLVKRHNPSVEAESGTGFHTGEFWTGVDGTSFLDGAAGIFGDPHAAISPVQESVVVTDLRENIRNESYLDGRPESTADLRPQEGDAGNTEARQTKAEHQHD